MNGHTVAGGLLFALCHDFRIMKQGPFITCMSEINIGLPINPGYSAILKYQLDP